MARRSLSVVLALVVWLGLAVMSAPAEAASAPAPATVGPVTSPLTCTAKSGYTAYTITGTLTMPDVPSNLTVSWFYHYLRYTSSGTTSNIAPVLDNTYAGGYYLTTYGWNAWKAGNVWLLLPSYTWGAVAAGGLAVGTGGTVPMTCKAPTATGVTGRIVCSAKVTGDPTFYTVTGTVVAPSTLKNTTVSVTRSGVTTTGAPTTPVLDNTFWGGYWLTTYGYNSWDVAGTATAGTWLLVPAGGLSPSFAGLMVIVYQGAGNNQLPAACTIT